MAPADCRTASKFPSLACTSLTQALFLPLVPKRPSGLLAFPEVLCFPLPVPVLSLAAPPTLTFLTCPHPAPSAKPADLPPPGYPRNYPGVLPPLEAYPDVLRLTTGRQVLCKYFLGEDWVKVGATLPTSCHVWRQCLVTRGIPLKFCQPQGCSYPVLPTLALSP